MTLPTNRIIHQYDNASVVYTCEHSAATGFLMPKLTVQVIDAYRYQRELYVQYKHEPGNSKTLYWEWVIYRHPAHRNSGKTTEKTATAFITRFLTLCDKYPTLLFNPDGENGRARAEGFVHMAEALHADAFFGLSVLP